MKVLLGGVLGRWLGFVSRCLGVKWGNICFGVGFVSCCLGVSFVSCCFGVSDVRNCSVEYGILRETGVEESDDKTQEAMRLLKEQGYKIIRQ